MEFKVGDKLRYIGARSCYYTEGGVYELQGEHTGTFWVTDDESSEAANHEWDFWDLEANFERIDEPKRPQATKVKLTQEQADAIEWLIKTGWDVEEIINDHYRPWAEESAALNDLSAADLARALLIGYDVEQTAAEKLVEYYQECKEQGQQALARGERHEHDINAARVQAINTTVSLLGIEVKGINAK